MRDDAGSPQDIQEQYRMIYADRPDQIRAAGGPWSGVARAVEQRFDLRADIDELHRHPVDLPRDRPGGFKQRAVNGGIVVTELAPGRGEAVLVTQESGLKGAARQFFLFVAHRDRRITVMCVIGRWQ